MGAQKKPKSKPRILSALHPHPLYGYLLVKSLSESSPDLLKNGEGFVYPLLRRLEGLDLVEGTWKPNPKDKRRRYYSLTKKGRRKL